MGTPEGILTTETDDGAETRPTLELVVDNPEDRRLIKQYGLTKKDLQILGALASGFVPKQIADQLDTTAHYINKALIIHLPEDGSRKQNSSNSLGAS
jgi:FixJ family two-component response regulator